MRRRHLNPAYYPETEVSVRPPDAIAQELSDSDEILAVSVIMAREIDRMPRESSFLPKEGSSMKRLRKMKACSVIKKRSQRETEDR